LANEEKLIFISPLATSFVYKYVRAKDKPDKIDNKNQNKSERIRRRLIP
jgi:hypothetical protein